ncbi:glycosyltransferase family 2 protein [Methanobacterium alcaliphilum]|uniref:glycosyltransferase family 2 protein n=1 Tax=Methanobacterium alcaliphilum TaxID=392018 RepID=UPI00200B7EBB|nr:glycosyltransferase family 2 protein [Methanobacterium alcaliphilum]MCK9152243.1 glycosyltransferase family 2 protein [Methanobacterium alcaliphilum]
MSYLISIIVPLYNAEKYIEKGLESIINQSIGFKNLEVILVNDNSMDSTLEVLQKYAKKYENIKIISLAENHGHPGVPRNIGMDAASADYLMFMDQDDFFEPTACEILHNRIIKEDVDIVSGRWYKLVDDAKIPFRELESEIKIDSINEDPSILGHPAFIWVKIFRKSFLKNNDIYFPETGIEDVVFTSHAFLKASGIIMLKDDYIYTHYANPHSISRSKSINYLNQLLIGYREAYLRFKKNDSLEYIKYLINMRLTYFLDTLIRSELSLEENEKVIIEFQKLYKKSKDMGATPGERLKLLFILIETQQFKNAVLYMQKLNYVDKLGRQNKILKQKNKDLKKQNKSLKEENKIMEEKMKKRSNIKGYIKYKTSKLKK